MTEKDIIKALECCKKDDCDNCPAKEYCDRYADLIDHPTEKGGEEE